MCNYLLCATVVRSEGGSGAWLAALDGSVIRVELNFIRRAARRLFVLSPFADE